MRYLITGGAGFVGSSIAKAVLTENPSDEVVVLDNLKRLGSEQNVPKLVSMGTRFIHGDVRSRDDFDQLDGRFDVMIEASAEPSVHAGVGGSPRYVIDTNLGGAINCLEYASKKCGAVIFLSTSRVYSIEALNRIDLESQATRFELAAGNSMPGLCESGINEQFDTSGSRSYYGSSKLAAELLCQEYAAYTDLNVMINRCGVIAGPGQFGKTDQGVFTLWVARHYFNQPLKYTGYGGKGLQVRDLLHPADLFALLQRQISDIDQHSGQVFNVGGGRTCSASLQEFTAICQSVVGKKVGVDSEPATNAVDMPWYISDNTQVSTAFEWSPVNTPENIVTDIFNWIKANETSLRPLFT